MLPSSTTRSGHTLANRSFLVTTSPGRSTRAIRMSRARLPSRTGTPSFSKTRSVTKRLKGPKQIGSGERGLLVCVSMIFIPSRPDIPQFDFIFDNSRLGHPGMGWTQIAQVVLRTIDRLHGSTAQHHPHQDRHMARPPSVLRMPFTTDRLPGPLAQEYFKQDIGVASPAT